MEYKNLNLQNLDQLKNTLSDIDFLEEFKMKSQDDKKTTYELTPNEGKKGLLNVFHNKDGKTTLGISQGGNPDLSTKVADIIIEKHQADVSAVTNTLTLNGFKAEDFETIIGYFHEDKKCETIRIEHEHPKNTQIKLSNKYGSCNITHYSNGTLCIQGKPSVLKLEIFQTISLLCSEYSEELIKGKENLYQITMLEDDIVNQLKKLLPNSYDYLKGKLLDYLKQAVVLSKITLPQLPDYSCKVDTVFIVIEGVLKKILKEEFKINFDNFGDVFSTDQSKRKFKLLPDKRAVISSDLLSDKLETLYNLFNKRRHSLLHFTSPAETKELISTEEEANILFLKCMVLIDESIESFLEK